MAEAASGSRSGPSPAIGAEWISAHGQGRLQDEQREELRLLLLRDLESRAGGAAATIANDEVGRFLASGRVSESNLSRLERRVLARLASGSLSARGSDARSTYSESAHSKRSGALSARGPREGSAELEALLRGLAPQVASAESAASERSPAAHKDVVSGPLSRWSEVAKYSKLLEDQEKVQRRDAVRCAQQRMRQDLHLQVEEKKHLKLRTVQEEHRLFEHQEAELEQWKSVQSAREQRARHKELEVQREREMQDALSRQQREEERKEKMIEDQRLVQKLAHELEQEQKSLLTHKWQSQRCQLQMAEDCSQGKKGRTEDKTQRVEDERRQLKEYVERLERQEMRNKHIPLVPPDHVVVAKQGRRGEDMYKDENVMKQLHEANRRHDEAELHKKEKLKADRLKNQDFIFQQIAERDRLRRQAHDLKDTMKVAAQVATTEHLDTEQKRINQQRGKNVLYRLELEQAIVAKRSAVKPRQFEDVMSSAEKAINRRLLAEAQELRSQVLSAIQP